MSNVSDFTIGANAETDREHRVQLALLQALCDAMREHREASSVGEIIEQLIAFSEAHFMSEELLMRLKSYEHFEDHADEHIQMLDVLNQIAADHAAGRSSQVSDRAEEVLGFIGNHIATCDKRFADYMRDGQ